MSYRIIFMVVYVRMSEVMSKLKICIVDMTNAIQTLYLRRRTTNGMRTLVRKRKQKLKLIFTI